MSQKNFTINTGLDIVDGGNVTGVTNLTASGNITANYFVGNGSQLTGISSTGSFIANGTSNVDIATANGNATVTTAGTYTWIFDTTGNLTVPNAIVSNTTIDIDNRVSGNSADIRLFAADDITIQARDRTVGSTSEGGDINILAGDSAEDGDSSGGDVVIEAGAGGAANVDFGGPGGFITIQSGQGGAAIGNSGYSAESGGALTLNAGDAGSNNGNIDLGADGGNVYIGAGDSTGNGVNGGTIYLTSGAADASALAGDVVIQAGGTWTFAGDGTTTFPSNLLKTINGANAVIPSTAGTAGAPLTISAGTGGIAATSLNAGNGGNLTITAGDAGSDIGNPSWGALGGTLVLKGGNSTQPFNGSNVEIRSGNSASIPGVISLYTGTNQWTFDNTGNLILPRGGVVYETNIPDGGLNGNTIALAPSGGTNADQQLLIYPTTNDANHLHLTSGNLYSTELFLGDDNLYVKLANTGNVVINSNDGVGNDAQWTFGADSRLINLEGLTLTAGGQFNICTIATAGSGYDTGSALKATTGGSGTGMTVGIGYGLSNQLTNVDVVDPGTGYVDGDVITVSGGTGGTFVITRYNDQANQGNNNFIESNWVFANAGNLTLPGNTFAVNYANGDPVTFSGGSGNTGNVTFNDVNIIGDGNLRLQPDPANASAYLDIFLTGGPDIHIAGNGETVILGTDDFANVTVNVDGNVSIQAGNVGGTQTWNFGTDGSLTVPGNIQTISTGFPFSSNISGINTGSPTVMVTLTDAVFGAAEIGQVTISGVVGTTQANDTWYYASIDPSNFVLYNDAAVTIPVNGNTWTAYISGGLAVSQGYSNVSIIGGNVNIVTNTGNTWTFGGPQSDALYWPDGSFQATAFVGQALDLVNPGNASITSNSTGNTTYVWTFGDDGRLTFPGTPRIDTDSDNFEIQAAENISLEANAVVNIYTDSSGNTYQWQFGDDGSLTLPIGVSIDANVDPLYPKIIADSGKLFSVQGQGNTGSAALAWTVDPNAAGQYAAVAVTRLGDNLAKVILQAQSDSGNVETVNLWKFDETGNLTLPGNTFAVNYANGTPVSISGGGGGNTGNVTFSDQIVIGTGSNDGSGGLYLAPGTDSVANSAVQYLQVRGGDYPTHIHFDTGNNAYYDQYFGDDGKYLKLEAGGSGNVVIGTEGDSIKWTFDNSGNLTLPKNSAISETTPATGAAASVNVKQSESSIANGSFVTLPPATVTDYNVPSTDIIVTVTWVANGPSYYAPRFAVVDGGTGHTGGGEFGGGDVLTVPYVDMGITGGGNWTWYVETIASDLTLEAGLNSWTFTGDSNLLIPGNILGSGNILISPDSASSSSYLDIYLTGGPDIHIASNDNSIVIGRDTGANVFVGNDGEVSIRTDNGVTPQVWNFTDTGNLTLPGNTFAVNYANGNPVTFTANTGNVTFSGETVIGTGTSNTQSGLYLAPDPVSLANDLYLRVRGNILDEPTHIHFDTGNNQYYNQIIGDDNKYIQLANTGNIVINTNNYAGNSAQWTFDTTGNLTLPGNLVIAGNTSVFGTDAALIAPTDDLPLIALSSGANGAVSSLWVEDYANVGASNIAAVYANPTPESKIVRIAVGQNGSPGPNLWDFDSAGNLSIPGNINFSGDASAAPSLNDFFSVTSAANFAIVTDNANTDQTWNFDSTGNLTLPANAFAINYANGTQVSLGGGNVTWAQLGNKDGNSGPTIITLGQNAGFDGQGNAAIAIGKNAGAGGQGASSITIGEDAGGNITQGANAVAIGKLAGFDGQGIGAVAIGSGAGSNTQGNQSVAIGENAGVIQGSTAVAIGQNAGGGVALQGDDAVAIGHGAGENTQGTQSVAIGLYAGRDDQGIQSVAIGSNAGLSAQGNVTVAIGNSAGESGQGISSVAIGDNAGQVGQGIYAVAIGIQAGNTSQGNSAVAIGENAGYNTQGISAVAVGDGAGRDTQGQYAVAVGYGAGNSNQANNSIIINATGSVLEQTTPNTFTVKPVRQANTANAMYYDASTGEITYDTAGGGNATLPLANGTSNFDIATANGNATITANASSWTFDTTGNLTTPGGMIINGNINTLGSQTALLQPTDDLPLSFIASGANGTVTSYWAEDVANLMSSNIAAIYTPLQGTQTVRIVTGTNGGNIAIYDFDNDGMFTAGAVCATGNVYASNVSASGNVTGNYILGNGSQLTNLPAPTVAQDIISNGAMSIMLYDGTIKYNNYATVEPSTGNITGGNILTSGLISATGNITGNYFIGNGSQLTNLPSTNWANIGNITNANGPQNIAIGENVHQTFTYTPGFGTVAIGYNAGQTNQGGLTVAVGWQAGQSNQSNNAIAIGYAAGQTGQEDGAVAIGAFAGSQSQGADAISIGKYAGYNGVGVAQPDNTIFLNATGTNMGGVPAQTNSFYVAPVRNDVANIAQVMFYNTTSKEITYGDVISVAGNITAGNLTVGSGTITGGNVNGANFNGNVAFGTGTVGGSGNITGGNISAIGNITGAYILGNGSQLTGIAASYGNANVATFLAAYGSNTITTTGNITAGNLIGNISITGNVTGTSANVTLVAGAYSTVFDNTGNLTLPGNTFAVNYANNTPVNAVTRFESAWTVPTGNSTQSFTVAASETYYMWVDCNIPNGILTWNATATITNTNVPVVGAQYAWVYNGGGTPIDFTSIPNQFIGTANTIVRSNVAPSSTTNRFDFGINNSSGNSQTVRYGWIAIS